jgi:hypothetical protein
VDQPVTEDPPVQIECLGGPPTFQRTVIEELYQNERRLTQFSRFSTKQMFPTDRAPWADAKNRPQYKESVQLPVSEPRAALIFASPGCLTCIAILLGVSDKLGACVPVMTAGGRNVELGR